MPADGRWDLTRRLKGKCTMGDGCRWISRQVASSLAQRCAPLKEIYVLDVNMRVKFGVQQP